MSVAIVAPGRESKGGTRSRWVARLLILIGSSVLAAGVAGAGSPSPVDWSKRASARTVSLLHRDEKGAARATTIWLAVSEGQGYVRGGSGRWVGHTLRDGDVAVRIGREELLVRATRVEDAAELERVRLAFRAKYGFGDVLATMVRGRPTVFRLTPR